MSSWDINGDPPEDTPGSPPEPEGGQPKPLLEWNASHDQMLIDAFTREGETPPSWLTNPNFALDAPPALAPLIFPADASPGWAPPPALPTDASPGWAPPISWFDETIPPVGPITEPHEALVLGDADSSLAEPPPSWLYASGVQPPPERLTGAYHRVLSPRGNLPWVAGVVVVLAVAVGSAVALGGHSGSTPNKRRPVAIAGQTTTSSAGTTGPSVTGTGLSDLGATTGASGAATPTDPAASLGVSAGAGASPVVAASGPTASGGVTSPPRTAQPPPFTQAPPPETQPPTTPPPPPTTTTTLPPTTTTRPPRTITTPPPITRPTLPTTSTTRPHR